MIATDPPCWTVSDADWLSKDDEALEHLLVERWLYRGGLLAVMLISAISLSYLGLRGINTAADTLTVGVVAALGVAAGALGFVMRLTDRRIHQELRRRKRERPGP